MDGAGSTFRREDKLNNKFTYKTRGEEIAWETWA
jgi:hypothetical protein